MVDAFGVERPDLDVGKGMPGAVRRASGGGSYAQSLRATRGFGRNAAKAIASPETHAPHAGVHSIGLGRSAKDTQYAWLAGRRRGSSGRPKLP